MNRIIVNLLLMLINFGDYRIQVSEARKTGIGTAEPRSFIAFRTNTNINQRACTCATVNSCSCCETVKIFYTSEAKRLCFNMVYQMNGLHFDISLDTAVIRSMTVANYRPFQLCSSIPGLLFSSVCVNILELNQFSRSITVCPKFEVSNKKERWNITYNCVSISTVLMAMMTGAATGTMGQMMTGAMGQMMTAAGAGMRPAAAGAAMMGQAAAGAAMAGQRPAGAAMTGQMAAAGATMAGQRPAAGAAMTGQMAAAGATMAGQRPAAGAAMTGQMAAAGATMAGQRPAAGATMMGQAAAAGATMAGQRPAGATMMGQAAAAGATMAGQRPAGATMMGQMPAAGATMMVQRPAAGATTMGQMPAAGTIMMGQMPAAGATMMVQRPAAGTIMMGQMPAAGATMMVQRPTGAMATTGVGQIDPRPGPGYHARSSSLRESSALNPENHDMEFNAALVQESTTPLSSAVESMILKFQELLSEQSTETTTDSTPVADDYYTAMGMEAIEPIETGEEPIESTEMQDYNPDSILARKKRDNSDVFDTLHESNRCMRAYRICITRSKHYIVSKIRNPKIGLKTKHTNCSNKPARIVYGLDENPCPNVSEHNDPLDVTATPQSLSTTASQSDDTLDAIVVHDEASEESDYYPQSSQRTISMMIPNSRPEIFPDRTPPLIALQVQSDFKKIKNETVVLADTPDDYVHRDLRVLLN